MARNTLIAAIFGLLLSAGAASAHPGHGESGDSSTILHYLTEPTHLFGLLSAFLVVGIATRILARRRRLVSASS